MLLRCCTIRRDDVETVMPEDYRIHLHSRRPLLHSSAETLLFIEFFASSWQQPGILIVAIWSEAGKEVVKRSHRTSKKAPLYFKFIFALSRL
jgi:hypothetical protein